MSYILVKNTLGEVISYGPDDGNYVPFLPTGFTLEKVTVLPVIKQFEKDKLQNQMDSLEDKAKAPRWLRETLMPLAVEKALTLGYTEPQLYATNIAYKKIKDLDTTITGLRDQMAVL